ncbi:16S rRNA (cytosine(1402)-N(4))-methyltransferase RsmH [Mesorhizobium sp. J428]|uniref:16S rRNA (cytosine(1402)-N(4))-methyltransferase RsmH n=1 Tax=Mesorhizobium sp. J428 TaxID=2898440 RepID=UPI002150A5E0|nr:16S rRNA (cytosine(1402)-N(4))-methyltransferase RsmH [Mesorhizobium sp. J428]MCR5855344.1 16S rRNA (cytosine(1402)-N(4))-methyltransferase RsmH [Mesorhizobium sp. J428]
MMADPGVSDAGGGPVRHIPVLLDEVLAALQAGPRMLVVDGTFGAGSYTRAILDAGADVVAIDRDPNAIADGRALEAASAGRLRLVHGPFSRLDEHAGQPVDAVVLDIGVSSMQIDEAERGFSFRHDGPLDMRMAQRGVTAADVVNTYKPGDLARVFGFLGEERHAGRIARMIEKRRASKPFATTLDLAQAIETLVGRNPKDRIHPATRVFQALRIHVNDELGELSRALMAAERALRPGGRLAVVTFHSLEDRIVKRFLADRSSQGGGSRHLPQAQLIPATFEKPAQVVAASDVEAERNPRARSAKLRSAVRTDAAPRREDVSLFGLPDLPDIRQPDER